MPGRQPADLPARRGRGWVYVLAPREPPTRCVAAADIADSRLLCKLEKDSLRPAGPFSGLRATDPPHRRRLKAFINIFDVAPDGGPFAVVPKSHKLEEGPWETLRRSFKSSLTLDAEVAQTDMPNHFRFACPAGTWLLFDQATWRELAQSRPRRLSYMLTALKRRPQMPPCRTRRVTIAAS